MTESLVVDPARLKAAGVILRDQVLPTPPAPISAAGGDPVSAAINVTMPVIEAPVVAGLPDVQAALTNTGSKIVTAAEKYAETDQLLGAHVGTVQFLAAGEQPAGAATQQPATVAAPRQLGAETADNKGDKKTDETPDKKPDKKPQPVAPIDFNQVSAMTQAAQPLTQGMQSIMSSMQGMGNAGAPPAKLADDTKKDDTKTPDEPSAQLVDATTQDAEGAASGKQGSGSAPVQSPTGGRPETTPAETGL